jgi:hypothetical protein
MGKYLGAGALFVVTWIATAAWVLEGVLHLEPCPGGELGPPAWCLTPPSLLDFLPWAALFATAVALAVTAVAWSLWLWRWDDPFARLRPSPQMSFQYVERGKPIRRGHAPRDVAAALHRAHDLAGLDQVDGLALLLAVLENPRIARLVRSLGADPAAIGADATARRHPEPGPGPSDDYRAIIEASVGEALGQERPPVLEDFIVGIASVEGPARDVLEAHGLTSERLRTAGRH